MAKKEIILDDLDGSEGASTVVSRRHGRQILASGGRRFAGLAAE
jgi:hypothetical protein